MLIDLTEKEVKILKTTLKMGVIDGDYDYNNEVETTLNSILSKLSGSSNSFAETVASQIIDKIASYNDAYYLDWEVTAGDETVAEKSDERDLAAVFEKGVLARFYPHIDGCIITDNKEWYSVKFSTSVGAIITIDFGMDEDGNSLAEDIKNILNS